MKKPASISGNSLAIAVLALGLLSLALPAHAADKPSLPESLVKLEREVELLRREIVDDNKRDRHMLQIRAVSVATQNVMSHEPAKAKKMRAPERQKFLEEYKTAYSDIMGELWILVRKRGPERSELALKICGMIVRAQAKFHSVTVAFEAKRTTARKAA